MYEVVIHKKVAKKIKSLPKSYLKKFARLIETLKINPLPWKDFDLKKIEGSENTYRIRIGDYRVVYFIEKEKKNIHILKFEKRGRVYKSF